MTKVIFGIRGVDGLGPGDVLLSAGDRVRQEFGSRERIEIEHLSPGELSVANLVQAKNRGVKLPAGAIASALMSQPHDLIVARGNRARLARDRTRSGSDPSFPPARPSFHRCLQAVAAPRIRQRPRPVELQVIVGDLSRELRVALLNRPKHLQQNVNGAHR
jgi:hypothetical protein